MSLSNSYIDRLKKIECRDSTYVKADPALVFEKAEGSHIYDVDSKKYVDLCAGFGVMAFGHNSQLSKETFKELSESGVNPIVHGMGDVYASKDKVELIETLLSVLPSHLEKAALALSGSQAVELALKTSLLSGKTKFISFKGSYHGLDLGVLPVTSRNDFKDPFNSWISKSSIELPFHCSEKVLRDAISSSNNDIAAIIVEPVQGRAGIRKSEDSWLKMLRDVSKENGIDLIFDEVFTGLGRIGSFTKAFEVKADIVCFGKALGGGLPLSAIVATKEVMDRWPMSKGEAIHTGTFFGHPLSCRLGKKTLDKLVSENWLEKINTKGQKMADDLREIKSELISNVRQYGMMIVLEFKEDLRGARLMDELRAKGVISLASGERGESVSFTPAYTLKDEDWQYSLEQIKSLL